MELVRDAGTGNGPAVNSSFTGSGDAHTIVQSYIVVYMWTVSYTHLTLPTIYSV